MVLSQSELQHAESGILRTLRSSDVPYSPSHLLRHLADQGISEYSARVAIWYLIDRNLVELTMDRMLRAAHPEPDEVAPQGFVLAGD